MFLVNGSKIEDGNGKCVPIREEGDATHCFYLHLFQFLDFLHEQPNRDSEIVYLLLKCIDIALPQILDGSTTELDPSGHHWSQMRLSHHRYDGGGGNAGGRR